MEWLKEHWFKIGILLILLLAIALVAYYFMFFIPQKEAAKEAAINSQKEVETFQRSSCVTQAQQSAISEYEDSYLCQGSYAPATCSDKSTYLVSQYNNAYSTCLQGYGLQ